MLFGGFEIVILLTDNMQSMPSNIMIKQNWGTITIKGQTGKHVLLHGEKGDVLDWLKTFDKVWVNKKGRAPINREFESVDFNGKRWIDNGTDSILKD